MSRVQLLTSVFLSRTYFQTHTEKGSYRRHESNFQPNGTNQCHKRSTTAPQGTLAHPVETSNIYIYIQQ